MAAGRVDVSRRRVSYDYSRKVDDGLRYTSHESRHRVYRRDCEISRRNDRGGRFEGRERSLYVEADEKKRITKSEDGVDLPPEKKRKFSPIIWNILEERKDVKPTKSEVDLVVNSPSTPQSRTSTISDEHGVSSPLSVGEGVEFQPGSRENCSTRGSVESSGSESSVISNLMATDKECCDDDRRLDKEECEVPKLSMSRWASDSPVATTSVVDDDVPLQNELMDHSSPESGEFRGASMDEDESGSGYDQDCLMGSAASDEYLRKGPTDAAANVVELNGTVNVSYQTEPVEVSCGIPEPLPSPFQGCRSVFEYKKLNEISEGTYGKVYKAMDLKTGQVVALKKVKMDVGRDANLEEYGFPLSSLREINILMSLRHPSIVNVREVVMGDLDSVFLVMEYMEHELRGLLQTMKQPFSTSEVKCLMVQLLKGVKYLHDNWVLHRDLKTSNLLLNNDGELKICDFGMSRQYGSPLKPYTSLVVTLWYRAPELLLGAKQYSTAVDMWSVGCIMAELLAKEPLFKGRGEIDQLDKIFRTLGTPSEACWPGFSKLPGAKAKFVKQPHNLLRKKFPAASFTGSAVLSDLGLDLLNGLLAYNPEQRITAEDALNHPWFHEVPLPKSKELMPTFLSQCAKKR